MKKTLTILSSIIALSLMMTPASADAISQIGVNNSDSVISMNTDKTMTETKEMDLGHEDGS